MRAVGRFLQLVGLTLLPLAIVLELQGGLGRPFGVSDMVIMMLCGTAAFTLGYVLESMGGTSGGT